jgi:Tol biopolymer transport system component
MPLWSPDGRRLVYRIDQSPGATLYQKAWQENSSAELLYEGVSSFAASPLGWSPDGRQLIYQSHGPQWTIDVWTLSLTSGTKPAPALNSPFDEGQAQLSPDGRWTAYVSNESGRFEVYVRAFPSGDGKQQVSTAGGLEPRWRGDGRELFYLSSDRHLMSVSVQSGARLPTSPPSPLFETRMSNVFNPSYTRNQYVVSADGNRFLINQPASGTSSSPITVVFNWPTLVKR